LREFWLKGGKRKNEKEETGLLIYVVQKQITGLKKETEAGVKEKVAGALKGV